MDLQRTLPLGAYTNANVARVRWFMPAASTSDYRYLLDMGLLRICTDHDFVSQQTIRAWVKHGQALHHFFHGIFGTVNELFHDKANVQRRVAGYLASGHFAGKQGKACTGLNRRASASNSPISTSRKKTL